MGAGMAVSMAAMMVPSAAPFFVAYGRDTRRPLATATVVLIYVAAWMAIGVAVDFLMSQVMMPTSLLAMGIAVAVALVYAITPWGRWARERCRAMSVREPRGPGFIDAAVEGASYAACCIACSAGLMLAVIVLGMSNPLVIVGGAVALLAYKLVPWPSREVAT